MSYLRSGYGAASAATRTARRAGKTGKSAGSRRLAPSASNRQNWKFVVVQDKATIARLVEACNGQAFVGQAPVIIAACAHVAGLCHVLRPARDTVDLSIATAYLILEAYEQGLGTVGWAASPEARSSSCSASRSGARGRGDAAWLCDCQTQTDNAKNARADHASRHTRRINGLAARLGVNRIWFRDRVRDTGAKLAAVGRPVWSGRLVSCRIFPSRGGWPCFLKRLWR